MELLISNNKKALFNTLNQKKEKDTYYMCTFFGPAVNLKYNTGISLTHDEIKEIAEIQYKKGVFSYKTGGQLIDGNKAVYEYIKNRDNIKLLIFKKSDPLFNTLFNAGYAINIGIAVNSTFIKDAVDGKVENYKDYINYKGSIGHCTNVVHWNGRGDERVEEKDFILDSYAFNELNREWLYECDIQELKEDIMFNTCFCFV